MEHWTESLSRRCVADTWSRAYTCSSAPIGCLHIRETPGSGWTTVGLSPVRARRLLTFGGRHVSCRSRSDRRRRVLDRPFVPSREWCDPARSDPCPCAATSLTSRVSPSASSYPSSSSAVCTLNSVADHQQASHTAAVHTVVGAGLDHGLDAAKDRGSQRARTSPATAAAPITGSSSGSALTPPIPEAFAASRLRSRRHPAATRQVRHIERWATRLAAPGRHLPCSPSPKPFTPCSSASAICTAYGPPVDHAMVESDPLAATSIKGRVRAQVWRDALEAHEDGHVRATELRSSDYFGPRVLMSRLSNGIIPKIIAGKPVSVLGQVPGPTLIAGPTSPTLPTHSSLSVPTNTPGATPGTRPRIHPSRNARSSPR